MATIAQVSQAMQTVLTTAADTAARATGLRAAHLQIGRCAVRPTLTLGVLSSARAHGITCRVGCWQCGYRRRWLTSANADCARRPNIADTPQTPVSWRWRTG